MKNIINNIKALLHIEAETKSAVSCNYSNNYYGDQLCMLSAKAD